MILAAFLYTALAQQEGKPLTARSLRATADALDERATEIAVAATRLASGEQSAGIGTPSAPPLGQPAVQPVQQENGTSRESPVPLGQPWSTPDGLVIRVLFVNFDAWEVVVAENQFNDPPADGMRMVLTEVEVTNAAGDANLPRKVDDSDYRVVGDRGIYSSYGSETRCGVIPNELDWELFKDATITGNICVVVPKDEGSLRLIYKADYEWDNQVIYFDLAE
jgi:hypothetical protein